MTFDCDVKLALVDEKGSKVILRGDVHFDSFVGTFQFQFDDIRLVASFLRLMKKHEKEED
jgi:hypothetical protein